MNTVVASLVDHDHYPEAWHHYQLSAPVACPWVGTDQSITGLIIAHVVDPVDGEQITQVTYADHHGQPDPDAYWRTLDGDQVTPAELTIWILTRHATLAPAGPSHQVEA